MQVEQELPGLIRLDRGDARARDLGRQADIKVDTERLGDLFVKESADRAVLGVDAANQLALIPAVRKGVIPLLCARLPGRFLPGKRFGQHIRVGDLGQVERLVDGAQAGLVAQQLAHRDVGFAVLGELGPVRGHLLVVVGQRHRHRGKSLGGRHDRDHGIGFPGCLGGHVANAAPEIDDQLALVVDRAGGPQLFTFPKVALKGGAYRLEARGGCPINGRLIGSHGMSLLSTYVR